MFNESIKEIVSYDKDTGVFVWKNPPSNRVKRGSVCNRVNSIGYIVISINRKTYLAHRLAWFFVYGNYKCGEIDHINRVKNDNRLCNLRLVSSSENSRNLPITKRNNSGTVGVSWYKNRNKWRATIMNNNRQIHLGYFDDKEEAIRIRKSYEKEYNYHENHGK